METAEMKALIADRRRNTRTPKSFHAVIRDRRGCILLRGRTTNISEDGVFIVGPATNGHPAQEDLIVELDIPTTNPRRDGKGGLRRVQYLTRVVRMQTLGHLIGVGLEFVERIA